MVDRSAGTAFPTCRDAALHVCDAEIFLNAYVQSLSAVKIYNYRIVGQQGRAVVHAISESSHCFRQFHRVGVDLPQILSHRQEAP